MEKKVNSVRIYPNDMEMSGDQVKMTLKGKQASVKSITTKIIRFGGERLP